MFFRDKKQEMLNKIKNSYAWPDCTRWITCREIAREIGAKEKDIKKTSREVARILRTFHVITKRTSTQLYFYIPNLNGLNII